MRQKEYNQNHIYNVTPFISVKYYSKAWGFITNNNIDESCLNGGKLHLFRKRTATLADNLRKASLQSTLSCLDLYFEQLR